MKVNGPGTSAGAPPDGTTAPKGPEGTGKAERAADKKGATSVENVKTNAAGRTFAETLSTGRPGAAPTTGTKTTGAQAPAGVDALTSDIASDLKAGRIDAKAALDRVVERVLDQQLGKNAPASLRDQLREALRDTITNDPFLTDRLRGLS
jgi:hypothetical protein